MTRTTGIERILVSPQWLWLLLCLGLTMTQCTCQFQNGDRSVPVDSLKTDSHPHQGVIDSPRPGQHTHRVSSISYAFFYLDASETRNRTRLQRWLKNDVQQAVDGGQEIMVYFSNYDQPVIVTDQADLTSINRALTLQSPSIPKPREEADRILSHLRPAELPWSSGDVSLHLYMSSSFHDISKIPFFDTLLFPFKSTLTATRVLIYTEAPIPDTKRLTYPGLKSISYIQLTNDPTL